MALASGTPKMSKLEFDNSGMNCSQNSKSVKKTIPQGNMLARGPQSNSYATITSDFKSKMSSTMVPSESQNVILNSTPLSLKVNGGMKPHYA